MVVKTVVEAQDIFDKAWEGFKGVDWKEKASVSRFVQANYTPYDGDESFLAGPTERSLHIKKIVEETKAHYEETRFPMDTRPTSFWIPKITSFSLSMNPAGMSAIDVGRVSIGKRVSS